MYKLSDKERIALVAENTDNLVVITDTDRKIVWVNEAYTIMTGYTLEEVVGQQAGFLQFEKTDTETVNEIREKLDKHLPVEKELLNRAKDGREYWVRLNISPVYKEGRFVGFISVERDITEEKSLINKLAQSELNYRAFFNSSQDRLVFIDRDYRLRSFNTATAENFKRNFNIDIKEGADFRDYISTPEQYQLLQLGIVPALEGKSFEFEAPATMPNGSSPWFKFRCVPVYGEHKEIIGVGVSWSDISKEKNLVKELEDAAIKYKAIIDSTEDRHVLIDLNNKLLAFNKSALKNLGIAFGFEMKEGDDFVEYFKGHEHVFKLQEGIAATHKNEVFTYESCVDVPGERCRWLRILYLPVKNAEDELIGTALNWTDISAQKQAQEQIEEHVKQLEEFSHITSHKLRQPLANIIGLTNLIAGAETPADEKEQLVAKLKTVADGLDTVIKEMTEAVAVLSFNKKQAGPAIKQASNSIYIIDDDPINNMITKKQLQRTLGNVAVKEFLNPKAALDELSKGNKPDLILLDINMEPMDGWGFLKEFEKLNLGVTVVMCSSSVDPADFSRAQEHPLVAEFLSKPLTDEHIKNLLVI